MPAQPGYKRLLMHFDYNDLFVKRAGYVKTCLWLTAQLPPRPAARSLTYSRGAGQRPPPSTASPAPSAALLQRLVRTWGRAALAHGHHAASHSQISSLLALGTL